MLGQRPARRKRSAADAGSRNPGAKHLWRVGQAHAGRAKHDVSETVVLRCLDSRQLDKVRCPEAAALCSSARPFAPRRAFSGQAKVARLANGSPFGGNSDDRRQWRKQGGVVGAAASKTQAKRGGCWVPQPGLGERSETERALRLSGLRLPASASALGAGLASCWPRPELRLPVSAAGGGRLSSRVTPPAPPPSLPAAS